jgi:hypothetical protein
MFAEFLLRKGELGRLSNYETPAKSFGDRICGVACSRDTA